MKWNEVWPGIVGAALGTILINQFMQHLMPRSLSQPTSADHSSTPLPTSVLTAVANELNQNLPMMVDSETELTTTVGSEALLVHNYRLVNYAAEDLDWPKASEKFRTQLVNAACSTPETKQGFIDRGVTLRYSYSGKNRKYLGHIEIEKATCSN